MRPPPCCPTCSSSQAERQLGLWGWVNGLPRSFFERGVCLFLLVTVNSTFTVVFCRFVGHILAIFVIFARSFPGWIHGTSHSGELYETGTIVLVRLWFVFLSVVAMAGSVLGWSVRPRQQPSLFI